MFKIKRIPNFKYSLIIQCLTSKNLEMFQSLEFNFLRFTRNWKFANMLIHATLSNWYV
jgi:hypothetical protein